MKASGWVINIFVQIVLVMCIDINLIRIGLI